MCRSRKGAWIEISKTRTGGKYPVGRSRKGAWIEIIIYIYVICGDVVAPARERGLKY